MNPLQRFAPHRNTILLSAVASLFLMLAPGAVQAGTYTQIPSGVPEVGGPAKATSARPKARKPVKPAKQAKGTRAPPTDYTGEYVDFAKWKDVSDFLDMMVVTHGFERAELDKIVRQIRLVDATITLIKPAPPGKPKNWQAYRARFVEPVRINGGARFWDENAEALERAEKTYGVPPEIIVGIIGVETIYGQQTGRFRVLDALTTLAFAYPEAPNKQARMEFFRAELEKALVLTRASGMDPFSLLGSYAGAVGLPQFMPSSILAHGIDFDGDQQVDLRGSSADAIGSVANFLVKHGWQRDAARPYAYGAKVSPNRQWEGLIGQSLEARHSQEELSLAGVSWTQTLPTGMPFGLVDLQNGAEPTEYWLGTANFFAITQYNRSFFYAMSVIELGNAIKQKRGG